MQTITSRQNPLYRNLSALKKDKGVMLLEGTRLVEDALGRGMGPRMCAVDAEYLAIQGPPGIPHVPLSGQLFRSIADTESPQGILAFFNIPWSDIRELMDKDKIIILDGLQDPGNVGTIIRTAEAFGFTGVILVGETANPFSPKAVRSSMGSCLGISIAKGSAGDLMILPHTIFSLVLRGNKRLSPALFKTRTAICLGRESEGISREIIDLSHETVFIPMAGKTESLNVAVAAGIVMACVSGVI
jgi:RNA methyltransferase, TrmH family